jgi:membrane-associated protease RseP (regulator of RpoE activity)
VLAAGLKRDHSRAGDIAALAVSAEALGEKRENARGVFLAAADTDEMPRLYDSVKGLAPRGGGGDARPTGAPRIAAFVNLAGLANLGSSLLVVKGTGTSPAWRVLIERVAARHPGVQFKLDDDPASAPELQQFVKEGIPALSLCAEHDRPQMLALENEIAKAQMAGIARATEAAIDLACTLGRDAALPAFSAYDAAAAKAAARATLRPYLGTVPDYAAAGGGGVVGVKLNAVKEGSPAQNAGVKAGDIVVELGGSPVNTVEDYLKALEALKPDAETEIKILRGGAPQVLKVTPGTR